MKQVCLFALAFMIGGCAAPMVEPPADTHESSYVGTNGPINGGTPPSGTAVDRSRDGLNHSGTANQNNGSSSSGGTTGP